MEHKIKAGDVVDFLPPFREDNFLYVAIDDEEQGRVTVAPIGTNLRFPPIQTIQAAWVSKVKA